MLIPKINKGTKSTYIKLTQEQLRWVFKITKLSINKRTICLFTPLDNEWKGYGIQLHLTHKKQLRIVYEGSRWRKNDRDLMSIIFDKKYQRSWDAFKGARGKRFNKKIKQSYANRIWNQLRYEEQV